MTYSEFTLTFNQDLDIGDEINIRLGNHLGVDITRKIREYWVQQRSQSFQVTKGAPAIVVGARSAVNFYNSFYLDYNATNNYVVLRNDNSVTIQSKVPGVYFYPPTAIDPNYPSNVLPDLPDDVDLVINNFEGTALSLVSLTFAEATTNAPCTHYKVLVETSIAIDNLRGTFEIDDIDSTTFSIEQVRGRGFSLIMNAADGQQLLQSRLVSMVPSLINSDVFEVVVNSSPNGATIIVNQTQSVGSNILEYSLDNTNWISDNTFTGLAEGNYVVYIRDELGCSTSISFSVNAFGVVRSPYFLMPKTNAIRFANRVTFSDCGPYKTDENTLSCEADVKLPHKEIQRFQTCDVDTTQFRTNYEIQTAKVIKADGSEVNVPIEKMSNNMDQKDRRDARMLSLTDSKTGVYFTDGKTYDYDTQLETGDYVLNGRLPDWAKVGNYFSIDNAWYAIEEIITIDNKNQVLVISNNYEGPDVAVIVSSIYDIENYEEYEFTIDMADYIDSQITVKVNIDDTTFDNIEQQSELIDVRVRQLGTVEIVYSNSTNIPSMNYSRGLQHTLRLLCEKMGGKPDDDSETYKSDSSALLLNADIRELNEFIFSPLTTEMMRKLVLALSHDTVSINGVSYVKNASIQVEGPLEDTNLHDVTALMIKANSAFNSNVSQGTGNVNTIDTELPGLIETEDGYVTYL